MSRLLKLRRQGRSRGQGITELALIAPILIIMLLITVDFGRLFLSYVTLNNVARVAANYGATNPGAFGGGATTNYQALVGHESAGLNCDLQADSGGNNPPIPTFPNGNGLGGTSLATMSCDFSLLTPLVTDFFGGPLRMTADAEFPIRTGAIQNVGGGTTLPPPGSPVAAFDFTGVSGGTVDGAGNVSGTEPVTVNVSDLSQNAQTYLWSWGDGSPDETVPNPATHVYSSPGTYSVTLTVTNTVGSSSRTRMVTVGPTPTQNPTADFYGTTTGGGYQAGGGPSGTPISGTYGVTVNFTNLSTNGTDYAWTFGDGGTSTAANPQHQYSALGIFTVMLDITQPAGGTPSTRTDYITVGCQVPVFVNNMTGSAAATWTGAHFTGTITYKRQGAPGNSGSSTTPPVPDKLIVSQSLTGGDFLTPTQQNKNAPWVCDPSITLTYAP